MRKVIIIGDSIAMAYGPLVKERLADTAEVWQPEDNAGTSANVLAHLEEWALSREADVIHLNCGAHDLVFDAGKDTPRAELPVYRENVRRILGQLKALTRAKVIWATITPMLDARQSLEAQGFLIPAAQIAVRNAAALEVSGEAVIDDLYQIIMSNDPECCLGEDGIHMTPYGNEVLAGAVERAIRDALA
jgi:isoamyl acetate esterase